MDLKQFDFVLFTARRFPLSQMPTLEVDGKVMTQSGAIGRYLAKEFGLYGDSSYDQALIDQVYETLDEISNTLNPIIFREKDEEMKVLYNYYSLLSINYFISQSLLGFLRSL